MNRLVILAPNWLGDAVMALPAIADVRRAAPAASISVAARASVAPLFALVPAVDDTLVLGDDEVGALASKRFDTALLLPNSTRAAIVTRRAGVPERWGYRTGWRGSLLTRAIPAPRRIHQIEYYQHLVRALGFPNDPVEPSVTVSAVARDAGRSLLMESGWDGRTPLVALAPGAAYGGAKRWPAEYFAELAAGLAGDGVPCVIVGTAADGADLRGRVIFRVGTAKNHLSPLDLVGRTDIPTLAGVFANCRALVTNDSGAMHLAAAIGISVTALFGPTDERATSPRLHLRPRPLPPSPPAGTEVVTILTHPIWCRPCLLRECPLDHRCMRGIDVATVLEAARSGL